MRKLMCCSVIELSIALVLLSTLQAQNAGSGPVGANTTVATPAPPSLAPDEMTTKITELVHAGKYPEAEQLTAGLLIAYPNDQRLIKAKALLDKLLATAQPSTVSAPSAGAKENTPAASQLTGMDKVEYNSLLELAREAQETTELDQQKVLLKQFMDQSNSFLEHHPDQMLLWQLRAASAISLNDPAAGYQAGQQLLAAGGADSSDPNLRHLLAQLNLKGWLDKKTVAIKEREKQFSWLLGTWNSNWQWWWGEIHGRDQEQFVISDSGDIEGYLVGGDGVKNSEPDFRGRILESGEIQWETFMPPSDSGGMFVFRLVNESFLTKVTIGRRSDPGGYYAGNAHHFGYDPHSTDTGNQVFYPSGWQPVISYRLDNDRHTMKIVIPPQDAKPDTKFAKKLPVTLILRRANAPQDGQVQ